MADPLLEGEFPKKGLNQAVAVAAMCLQDDASIRPLISDVVTALSFLGDGPESGMATPSNATPSRPETTMPDTGDAESSDKAKERELALAEAKEWGTRSAQTTVV